MNDLKEELKKAKASHKLRLLQDSALEQLLYLNADLLQRIKVTESSHRSLMNYIVEMHKNLEDNFNRTPIEEIWFRELGRFLKDSKSPIIK